MKLFDLKVNVNIVVLPVNNKSPVIFSVSESKFQRPLEYTVITLKQHWETQLHSCAELFKLFK